MSGNKIPITGAQVFGWFMTHLKLAPGFAFIFGIVGILIWELWAEGKVEIKIKAETEPIAKQVKELTAELVQVTFDSKQILLILEKTTDKRIIKEVREETEKFRPKVDSGK